MKAGDVVRVSLASTPGTGYTWRALEVDSDYLTLIDKVTAAPAASGAAPVVQTADHLHVLRAGCASAGQYDADLHPDPARPSSCSSA